MRTLPRTCALVLGAVLALAWTSTAEAQRGRGSRGRSDSSERKSESKKKADAPRKARPSQPRAEHRSPAPAYQPPRAPAYQPPRAPAYQPPRGQQPGPTRAPAYQPPREQPRAAAPAQAGRPARTPSYRPAPGPARPLPLTTTDRARAIDGRLAASRVPVPVSRVPAVPPIVRRGGKTFTQTAASSGGRVVVTRTSTPSAATSSPYAGGGDVDGVHDGHHGGHHGTTTIRHYHYYSWGYGYYYCYIGFWPYEPWFWGFYFAPFPAPWQVRWWWAGAPWYGYWGWYYSPYAVYVGPSHWVTDYTLARMLEAEYARGWTEGQAAAGTPISEPVKEQIRVQVDDVARTFQDSGALLLEEALADPEYLFIVDTPLSVAVDGGGTCGLTGGDIIRRAPGPEAALPVASMAVVTSKSEGCAAGSVVSVSYTDLQEMLNTFGQTVDDGLNELQKQQQENAAPEP